MVDPGKAGMLIRRSLLGLCVAATLGMGCRTKREPAPSPALKATPSAAAPSASAVQAPAPAPDALAKRTNDCWMAFNRGDLDELGHCYAGDALSHGADAKGHGERGRTAIVENQKKSFRTAFPDGKIVPQLVFVNGFDVLGTAIMSGTHTGPLLAPDGVIPATKKAFGTLVFFAEKVDAESRILEEWLVSDPQTMLAELGVSKSKGRPRNTQGLVNAPVITSSSGSPAERANVEVVEKGWRALAATNLAGFAAVVADDAVLSDQTAAADARGKQALLLATDAWLKGTKKVALTCTTRFGAGTYVASLCRLETTRDDGSGNERTDSSPLAEVVRLDGGLEKEIFRFSARPNPEAPPSAGKP